MSAGKRKRSNSNEKDIEMLNRVRPLPAVPDYTLDTRHVIESWYENPSWSDLTLELKDGRKIPVHKAVLCSMNRYFDSMFGLRCSPTAQARKTISLPDDDPDAVRCVIRKIYGHEISGEDYRLRAPDAPGWQYWRELIKVAVKFGEPKLADDAEFELFAYGLRLCKPGCIDGVCDIL